MKTIFPLLLTISSFLVACTPLHTTVSPSGSSTQQMNFSGDKVSIDQLSSYNEPPFVESYSGMLSSTLTPWERNIEKTMTGYLHHVICPYGSNRSGDIASVLVSFQDSRSIEEHDIKPGFHGHDLGIPKLDVFIDPSFTKRFDFGLTCFTGYPKKRRGSRTPEWFWMPSGTGEQVFISPYKELSSKTIPYVNYLEEPTRWIDKQVFPEYQGTNYKLADHFGRNDCIVAVGKLENFPDLPFSLKGKDSELIIAVTQNKTETSHCKEMLGHERTMEFYTDKYLCTLWADKNTSLKSIEI